MPSLVLKSLCLALWHNSDRIQTESLSETAYQSDTQPYLGNAQSASVLFCADPLAFFASFRTFVSLTLYTFLELPDET